jgi:hypothetical protein
VPCVEPESKPVGSVDVPLPETYLLVEAPYSVRDFEHSGRQRGLAVFRTRRWFVLGAALPALLASFVGPPASAADGRPYTNPIKSQKGADPWLEYYNGNYYLVTTSFTNERRP